MSLRIRRGTNAQRTSITFDLGEIVYTTDTQKLYIGDGVTAGGKNLLETSAGNGFTFNQATQQIDFAIGNLNLNTSQVTEDASRLYYTDERAQDAVAAALVAGNAFNTGITFTYNDANNRITAVSTGGLTNISADTNPSLGGNLSTGAFNISGNGSISAGTISATTGLGANLPLNGKTINGTGNINISGDVTAGTISATTGLGANLPLNGKTINGTGNINTTGAVSVTGAVTSASLTTSSISVPNGVSSPITCFSLNTDNVAVGTATTPTELRVIGLKDTAISINSLSSGSFDGGGPLGFYISGGTHAVPAKIDAEGLIGGFSFNGHNGTVYKVGGAMFAQVSAGTNTTGASFIKTDIIFSTSNGTTTINPVLTLRNDKVAESPCFRATPFADATARTAAIASPQAGMVTYLTSTNKLQAYNGTAWVDLH